MTQLINKQEILDFSAQEPSWLRDLRVNHLEKLEVMETPHQKQETWRRTRPVPFLQEGGTVVTPVTTIRYTGENNDSFLSTTMQQAVQENESLLKLHLCQFDQMGTEYFTHLNSSAWRGGSFTHVPKETSNRGEAIIIEHDFSSEAEAPKAYPHSIFKVEAFSNVTVIETFRNRGKALTAYPVIEIHAQESAKAQYVFFHDFSKEDYVLPHFHVKAEKDAHVQVLFVGLGGHVTKCFADSHLDGEGAKTDIYGVVLGDKDHHYDMDIIQYHNVGNTVSDVLFHCALTDNARSVFSGNVVCKPGSQKIDGYQQNRNLMLSETARADSMPKLEIEANDVRCTHGATFTTYDEAQMFYLQSRGLTKAKAESLLTEGFLFEVTEKLDNEQVNAYLEEPLSLAISRALDK